MLPRLIYTATFRLATMYVLLFALSVGVLFLLLYFSMRSTLETEVRSRIRNEVNLLLHEYREDGLEELLEETEERIEKNRPGERLVYMVQHPSGRVIFDDVAPASEPYGWNRSVGEHPRLMYFSPLDGGYVLGIGQDLHGIESMRHALLRTFSWSIGAVLVIGFAGGLFLSRRTLAQIDAITRAARAIGDGDLSRRVRTRGTGDELDALGQTLNHMLDRIERLVAHVRHVSSGIAHDLRTPLARLRNRLDSLRSEAPSAAASAQLDTAIGDVDDILATFAALLQLAELDSGTLKAGFRPVDLSELTTRVIEAYRPIAEESGIRIQAAVRDGVEVHGNARLLRQGLANLVENALRHAGTGIDIGIALAADERGRPVLEVADNGRGIPAADRGRLTRPFERLGHERPGSGFGLALVAAIARLHDARFELLDNDPGLLCRMTFGAGPAEAADHSDLP